MGDSGAERKAVGGGGGNRVDGKVGRVRAGEMAGGASGQGLQGKCHLEACAEAVVVSIASPGAREGQHPLGHFPGGKGATGAEGRGSTRWQPEQRLDKNT